MRQKGFVNIIVIVLVIVLVGALAYVSLVNKPAPVGQQIDNLENEQPLIKPTLPSPSEPPASSDSEEIVMNCNVFNRPSCLASKFYCKWVSNPSGSCIYKPISNRCGDIISKEICFNLSIRSLCIIFSSILKNLSSKSKKNSSSKHIL